MDESLLRAALLTARGKGPKVRVDCPYCTERYGSPDHKQSLSYRTADGSWKCYRCRARGGVRGVVQIDESPRRPVGRPEGFFPLAGDTSLSLEPARRYLAGRLPERRWGPAGIGACLRGWMAGRVVVPIVDATGRWIGHVGRAWFKKHPEPYRYPKDMPRAGMLYNEAALDGPADRPLFVVESVFDALHIWQDGQERPDAVAILGSPVPEQIERLAECGRPVVIALDPDAEMVGNDMVRQILQQRGWYRRKPRRPVAALLPLPSGHDPDELPVDFLYREAARCLDDQQFELEDWL